MAANKKPAKQGGALSTSPSTKPEKFVKPQTHKYKGVWVDDKGYKVDGHGRRLPGQSKPFQSISTAPQQNKAPQPVGTPNAPAGSIEEKFRNLSPEKQAQEMGADYGAYLNQAWAQEQQRLMQGQPDFSSQLESARQNVMGQFERTMGPEFQRQQMELRQRLAEQGIDPNSGAYQAQMKMLNDSQNNARQNAMSQAFTQGAEYQQQGFTQDVTGRLLPFQIGQLGARPWELGFAARTEAEQKEKDRQAALQQARISGGSTVSAAKLQADAARDAAAAQAMGQYNQPKQPNTWSNVASGIGTGAGAAATNWALR